MRHAFATFFFVASIAGFGGVANALPIASTAGTDVSKSTALKQEADDALFRGGSIALDQGANQWNHRGDDDWGCNPRRVL
jgi:hypothetical protein